MEKIDFKKLDKQLYQPSSEAFVLVEVPEMQFVKVDGEGDPDSAPAYARALQWLYGTSYKMKFAAKAALAKDYVVPPLEGLWWADDPSSFTEGRRDEWRWTMMIRAPDFLDNSAFEAASEISAKKLGEAPESLRFEGYREGLCLQKLHIGSYADEAPVLAALYSEIMPGQGLLHNGQHHEIYLNDPRKTPAEKLRTILRQPVKPS